MTSRATARTSARAPTSARTPRTARSAAPLRPTTGPTPRVSARSAPRSELRLVPGTTTVRPRRRVAQSLRNRRAPFVLLVVALLVGTTLGLLILNTAIAVDSLDASQLRAENAQRAQEVERLEQQVVTGGTPAEIAAAAVAAGLVPAGPAAYLVIDPDGTTVLRGTPVPAEGSVDGNVDGNADEESTDDEDEG